MKKVFLAIAMCFSICLTACVNVSTETEPDILSALDVKTSVQAQTVSTLSEKAAKRETSSITFDTGLIPGCVKDLDSEFAQKFVINLSETAELSKVTVNNADIDIANITLGEMLEQSGLERCLYGSTDLQLADYKFASDMYCIQSNLKRSMQSSVALQLAECKFVSDTYHIPLNVKKRNRAILSDLFLFDSRLSIEIVDENGNLVKNSDGVTDNNLDCAVKGVYASNAFTNDDFEAVFYGGVKCGMELDDAYACLDGEGYINGEAIDRSELHYFCNSRQVLIIMPKDGIVDGIMLLNI